MMAGLTGVDTARPVLPEQDAGRPPAVQRAIETAARSLHGGIRLRIFQPTGRVYAEVLDPETREVVKTLPPLEMLKVTARLRETLGLLMDREG
ncbi:MAG: flagellar protein FlaG [Planctomycetota bacterium]|jgi:uncharacterized FlaG/YvyC family protein